MNRKLKAAIILRFGTQEDFASVIKESTSVVSRVVRDRLQLCPEKKSAWANHLECDPRDIFLDDEKASASSDSQKQLVRGGALARGATSPTPSGGFSPKEGDAATSSRIISRSLSKADSTPR